MQGTSLADIAKDSAVPLGNIYYYFKTKDALVSAVLDDHAVDFQQFVDRQADEPNPRLRLTGYLDTLLAARVELAAYNCPVASLLTEVSKQQSVLTGPAQHLMAQRLKWVESQYSALNYADARERGAQFLAHAQGVIALGHAFRNPDLIARQIERLKSWVRMT